MTHHNHKQTSQPIHHHNQPSIPNDMNGWGEGSDQTFEGLQIWNDGISFRNEDWERIKSIADGNPDEVCLSLTLKFSDNHFS
jgi:hypothetical protein